jgi:hypothetical protein
VQAISVDKPMLERAAACVDMGYKELLREIRAFCLPEE